MSAPLRPLLEVHLQVIMEVTFDELIARLLELLFCEHWLELDDLESRRVTYPISGNMSQPTLCNACCWLHVLGESLEPNLDRNQEMQGLK